MRRGLHRVEEEIEEENEMEEEMEDLIDEEEQLRREAEER